MKKIFTIAFVFGVFVFWGLLSREVYADRWWEGDGLVSSSDEVQCPTPPPWQFEEGLGIPNLGGPDPTTGPVVFIRWFFMLALGFSGILALVMLVLGGVEYMASEATGQKQQARQRIQDALLGLILLLASVLILGTISPGFTTLQQPTLTLPDSVKKASDVNCAP